MDESLSLGYIDEVMFASGPFHHLMLRDEAAASFSIASLTEVPIARLAKIAVEMNTCFYTMTEIAIHTSFEIKI